MRVIAGLQCVNRALFSVVAKIGTSLVAMRYYCSFLTFLLGYFLVCHVLLRGLFLGFELGALAGLPC